MKVSFYVYVLTDAFGNRDCQVVKSPGDTLHAIGGYDAYDKYHQFDSYEGYYLKEWAEKREGFRVDVFEREIDVNI